MQNETENVQPVPSSDGWEEGDPLPPGVRTKRSEVGGQRLFSVEGLLTWHPTIEEAQSVKRRIEEYQADREFEKIHGTSKRRKAQKREVDQSVVGSPSIEASEGLTDEPDIDDGK